MNVIRYNSELIVRLRSVLDGYLFDDDLEKKGVNNLLKERITKIYKRHEKQREILSSLLKSDLTVFNNYCNLASIASIFPDEDNESVAEQSVLNEVEDSGADYANDDDNDVDDDGDDEDEGENVELLIALMEGNELLVDDDDENNNNNDNDVADE